MHASAGAAVLFAAAVTAQTTWIVDPNGTGNFTDLAPAITADALGVAGSHVTRCQVEASAG